MKALAQVSRETPGPEDRPFLGEVTPALSWFPAPSLPCLPQLVETFRWVQGGPHGLFLLCWCHVTSGCER